jgi:hypothetical protein
MSEYIPTTDEIEENYIYSVYDTNGETDSSREAGSRFDAWLKRHDREIAAKALRYAADDLTPGDDKVDDWGIEAGLLRARAAYYERGDVDV